MPLTVRELAGHAAIGVRVRSPELGLSGLGALVPVGDVAKTRRAEGV